VDASDIDRLGVTQEVLHEMARHPGLADRSIPFVILVNKQDLVSEGNRKVIGELEMRRVLKLDRLKTMNSL